MPRWPKRLTEEEKRERNRARCKNYYHANKKSASNYHRDMRKANPEKYRERDHLYYLKKAAKEDYQKRRYAKRDKVLAKEKLRQWRLANPEKEHAMWRRTYEKHRHKHLARTARWARNNPEARAAIVDRRRAREFGVSEFGNYTKDDIRQILKAHCRNCFYCSSPLKKFHADHFVPLSRGGTNSADNIVLSCPSCNFSKGGKLPWEWRPDKFTPEQIRSG